MSRRYRCPYCRSELAELPADGVCGHCGKMMRLPQTTTLAERAARRRRRERIRLEAERKIAGLGLVPEPKLLRSRKILFGAMFILMVLGALLVRKAQPVDRDRSRIPHRLALRHLDTLATALGRYRFHVGTYPATSEGLVALLNNPGQAGWDGPYINQLVPDPWGTPYHYELLSNSVVRLVTCGPDKLCGTPDDLRPDPEAFDPGTEWTNGWTSAINRLPAVQIMQINR